MCSWVAVAGSVAQVPDSLNENRSDTLFYLLSYEKDTAIGRKSDPIVKFFNSRDTALIVNRWLKSMVLRKHANSSTVRFDTDQLNALKSFDGKRVGMIVLKRLPPFGPSVHDTLSFPDTWPEKLGNRLRFTTVKRVIFHNLTFKSGERFNSSDLLESERLLRELEFIRDARIWAYQSAEDPDYVNIEVITQDSYPHGFDLDIGGSIPEFSIYTSNLFGQGVGFRQSFTLTSPGSSRFGFEDRLRFKNIQGTRINLEINYMNFDYKHMMDVRLDRKFQVDKDRYGGGIFLNRSFKNTPSATLDQFNWPSELNYYFNALWFGRKFNLNANNFLKDSKLYLTTEYLRSDFFQLPDTLQQHPLLQLNNYFFGAISFGKREFFKNNLVYSFGITEDVPRGFLVSLVGGVNQNRFVTRPYTAFHLSLGHPVIPNRGYWYLSAGWENYWNRGDMEQGTLRFQTRYITPLMKLGNNRLRSFLETTYVKGFHRLPEEALYIIERREGLALFRDDLVRGDEKMVVNLENVTFTPSRIWGFRMAIYTFADIAWINHDTKWLFHSNNFYAVVGGGIKLRNERLVLSTITLRLGYIAGDINRVPFAYRFTTETSKTFDDFLPEAPKKNLFR